MRPRQEFSDGAVFTLKTRAVKKCLYERAKEFLKMTGI